MDSQALGPGQGDVDAGKARSQPFQAALPPVMGSMVEFFKGDRAAYRIYITGDTLLHDRLEQIPKRYPDIDLALIHLGGTRIMGVLLTMDAAQGVKAEEEFLQTEIRFVAHGDVVEFVSQRAKELAEKG